MCQARPGIEEGRGRVGFGVRGQDSGRHRGQDLGTMESWHDVDWIGKNLFAGIRVWNFASGWSS